MGKNPVSGGIPASERNIIGASHLPVIVEINLWRTFNGELILEIINQINRGVVSRQYIKKYIIAKKQFFLKIKTKIHPIWEIEE